MRTSSRIASSLLLGVAPAGLLSFSGVLNAQTQEGGVSLPTFEQAVDSYGVDRMTGKYSMRPHTVLRIGGDNGLDLTFTDSGGSSLITNFFRKIYWNSPNFVPDSRVTIQFGTMSETFSRNVTTNVFTSEYPSGSSLDMTLGYLRYIDRTGVEVHFQTDRTRLIFPDGREITAYGADEIPNAVADNLGNMVKLSGSDDALLVQAVNRAVDYCAPTGMSSCTGLTGQRSATYVRDLTSSTRTLTDASGAATIYRMHWNDSPASGPSCSGSITGISCDPAQAGFQYYLHGITLPGSATENITIDYGAGPWGTQDDVRVRSITIDGDRVDYSIYNGNINVPPEAPQRPYFIHTIAKVNGEELYHSMALNPNGGLGQSRRELVNLRDTLDRVTTFGMSAVRQISRATYPEGNTVAVTYSSDGRNNPVTSSGGGITFTRTYAASCSASTRRTCNLPLTIADGNGAVTDYTYNARGQVLTVSSPAPIPGAPRPIVRNTYTERTAVIRDASGGTVAAGPAVSLLTEIRTCLTSSLDVAMGTCAAGAADLVTTTYDYGPTTGPNNLRLRGVAVTAANGSGQFETLRTCYTYNYFGEQVSKTAPAANLASCS